MKKIICILLCIFIIGSSVTAFAQPSVEESEVIPKETPSKPERRRWTGKEFTYQTYNLEAKQHERFVSKDGFESINTFLPSNIAKKGLLIWYNGYYIALTAGRGGITDYHFIRTDYTSPYYVLDENFNLVKTVEYPGRIIHYAFADGVFYYITQERVKDRRYLVEAQPSDFRFILHKTSDFVNIESLELNNEAQLYHMLPIYDNALNKKEVQREIYYSNPFTGANFYFTHDKSKYSLDGIYYQSHTIEERNLTPYAWYIDGYLCAENENAYYKFKVDWEDKIYVELNGAILAFEQPPVVEDGRTLVPMRFLFECLGDKVTWDEETRSVTAENENNEIVFRIGDTTADVNGTEQTMDVPAKLIGNKTYVPLRFLSENLGYTVTWDEETSTASIVSDPAKITQNTDIQCTINGLWIESFAIGGNQYIPVSVLPKYGFSVNFSERDDSCSIERDPDVPFIGWNTNKGKPNGNMNVLENTNRKVLLNGKETNTYLVNQRLVMQADELLALGSGGYNPETRCFEIQIP